MTTFKINKDKNLEPEGRTVTVFTFWNQHDFEDAEGFPLLDVDEDEDAFSLPDAYAIKVVEHGRERYYVKRGRYGKLYNPIGLYSEGTSRKQMRHAGRPEWTFQQTTYKIFNYYIKFLKTKNAAWLHNAEREV